ncbi:MAG: hypothetical protein GXP58_01460 [Deltaproteobacteria bacterium]|nr:hypothetical protein [Deltaproteobacteria bacterium]
MKHVPRLVFLISVTTVIVSLSGCALVGPMPPIVGPGGTGILSWVLISVVGYFVWHELVAMGARLGALEKEIKKYKTKGEL